MKKIKQVQVAQKAVTFHNLKRKKSVLLIKYDKYKLKSSSGVLTAKFGFPGGRLKFGEDLDKSLISECKEETGILIKPLDPIGLSTWTVEKEDHINQIVAIFRLCKYIKGSLKRKIIDEAPIEQAEWIGIDSFDFNKNMIKTELPVLKKALKIYGIIK